MSSARKGFRKSGIFEVSHQILLLLFGLVIENTSSYYLDRRICSLLFLQVNQPTNQSASQPTNQPANQPTNQTASQPDSQPAVSQPANQQVSKQVTKQTNKRVNK